MNQPITAEFKSLIPSQVEPIKSGLPALNDPAFLEEIDAAMHEDKLRNRYDSKREESAGLSFTERQVRGELPS